MWKKDKHSAFIHYWINEEKKIQAGLDRLGKFVMWSDAGSYDAVQCEDLNEAMSIMNSLSRSQDKRKK